MSSRRTAGTATTTRRGGVVPATGFATTGRRKKKKVKTSTKRYYTVNQRMTKERARLGLPPLKLKYHETLGTHTQYSAWANNQWNMINDLDAIAVGATDSTRESNVIKIVPCTFSIEMYQVAAQETTTRVTMIQVLDNTATASVIPSAIFKDTTSLGNAILSPYHRAEDRTFRFRVVYDKHFVRNTTAPRPTYKTLRIKRKAYTVKYDSAVAAGTTAENKMFLCVQTTATATSANYTGRIYWSGAFIDQ